MLYCTWHPSRAEARRIFIIVVLVHPIGNYSPSNDLRDLALKTDYFSIHLTYRDLSTSHINPFTSLSAFLFISCFSYFWSGGFPCICKGEKGGKNNTPKMRLFERPFGVMSFVLADLSCPRWQRTSPWLTGKVARDAGVVELHQHYLLHQILLLLLLLLLLPSKPKNRKGLEFLPLILILPWTLFFSSTVHFSGSHFHIWNLKPITVRTLVSEVLCCPELWHFLSSLFF